jgi:hypothetical protein
LRRSRYRRPDYVAYMASETWATTRRRYFRSGLPCTCRALVDGGRCGAEEVDLHHWTYSRLGRELLTDLIPLCRTHHERLHSLTADHSAAALKRATRAVCGATILRDQQEALAQAKRERVAPPPRRAQPKVRLRAAAVPAPRTPWSPPLEPVGRGEVKPWDTAQVRLATPSPPQRQRTRRPRRHR